jgi:hypothetical protein
MKMPEFVVCAIIGLRSIVCVSDSACKTSGNVSK